MANKRRFKSKALQYAYNRYVANNPERAASFEEELGGAEIASAIYKLRTRARLSQRELARRVGTTASVICRLEDADYEGHSLAMLRRIAAALGRRLQVRFLLANGRARRRLPMDCDRAAVRAPRWRGRPTPSPSR